MSYLNRSILLKYLKRHCLTTVGFEEAFARVPTTTLSHFFYMIEEHTSVYARYEEYIDFLDGNGFSVIKGIDNWYILTYLYKEESQ